MLGSHMLEVCPSIAAAKPTLEVHPLGIGGKGDPARLVFDAGVGPAINATWWTWAAACGYRERARRGEGRTSPCPSCRWPGRSGSRGPTSRRGPRPGFRPVAPTTPASAYAVPAAELEDFAAMVGLEFIRIGRDTDLPALQTSSAGTTLPTRWRDDRDAFGLPGTEGAGLRPPTWRSPSAAWPSTPSETPPAFDRARGVVAIKPSGVEYDRPEARRHGGAGPGGQGAGREARPSSDTRTHLVLYRAFPGDRRDGHTHSTYAYRLGPGPAGHPIYGTTHADHLAEDVPCTAVMTDEAVDGTTSSRPGTRSWTAFGAATRSTSRWCWWPGMGPFTWGETPSQGRLPCRRARGTRQDGLRHPQPSTRARRAFPSIAHPQALRTQARQARLLRAEVRRLRPRGTQLAVGTCLPQPNAPLGGVKGG